MNNRIKDFLLLCLCLISLSVFAQHSITGSFPPLAGQQARLMGFEGFDSYVIDSTMVSEQGVFTLKYTDNDQGMGYLAAADNKAYFLVLANENIQLKGEVFSLPESVVTLSGKENKWFVQYASEHPRREQALSAWGYLEKIYAKDSLFAVQAVPKQAIVKEKQRIKTEDSLFLANLPENSYVSYYLPLRKLVSSVSTVAQYRTEDIPETLAAFRAMDYTDERLYKSGLLGDVVEAHFWLIENSGRSLDSVYVEMNRSIDLMIDQLVADEQKFNAITDYLFKLLERRSLFTSSEYLAVKVLNEVSCTLDVKLAAQLESYRSMKKGNTAPDFAFAQELLTPGYAAEMQPKSLSDIQADYTLVVFGASWCPACTDELNQLAWLYGKWKQYGLEVVFVSLDENKQAFNNYAGIFPFISTCDYQKWDSPVVKAYHVFATPTMYLLDKNRKIILRPNSASHLDSWADWVLVQGKQ